MGFALYLYTSVECISDHFSKGWLLLGDVLGVCVSDTKEWNKLDQACPIVIAVICQIVIVNIGRCCLEHIHSHKLMPYTVTQHN